VFDGAPKIKSEIKSQIKIKIKSGSLRIVGTRFCRRWLAGDGVDSVCLMDRRQKLFGELCVGIGEDWA